MKKIISKILIILIVFLLLFDFIFASQYRFVYAAGGPGKTFVDGVTNLAGGLVAIVYTLLKALIVGLTYGVQVLTTVTASSSGVNTDRGFWTAVSDTVIDPITPLDIFFNKYKLLDINFFDFEGLEEGSYLYLFRMSIAEWYAIMKLIAAAILLVILIYVGIRMALSTIADDKAKYKKMLADWIVSLVLIFVLQYIIIFTIYCNDAIVRALETAFADNKMSSLASESIVKIGLQGIVGSGLISFASVLVYVFIVMQTIMFLLAYMKRMIKVGFLIMISPLISITYSIDKMGDGKAQALGNWLKEFVYTILIQPFHCIIYLALVQTAIELLQGGEVRSEFELAIFNSLEYNQLAAGVLAIMCLKFVNDGEQIVRKIFGFKDDGSTGFGAGAALGIAAIANAKKIGGATRKATNKFKAKGIKYGKAISNDMATLHNNRLNNLLYKSQNALSQEMQDKAKAKYDKMISKDALKENKKKEKQQKRNKKTTEKREISGARAEKMREFRAKHKVLSKMGDTLKSKASLSTALGIMGAAMMYSSGNTSALESIAGGTAIQKGTQEFFGSSNNTQANDCKEDREALEKQAYEEQVENKTKKDEKGNEVFTEEAKAALNAYNELDNLAKEKEKKEEEINNLQNDDPKLSEKREELAEIERKMAEQNEIIEKYDSDHNLAGYRDDDGNLKRNPDGTIQRFDKEKDVAAWKDTANKKFERERKDRFKKYIHKPDTKSLDKARDEIIAKLMRAKMESKENKGLDATLTVDEMDSINSTAQLLMDNISLGVLNKQGFGQEAQKKIIASQLGLDKDGVNHLYEGINDADGLNKSILQYENLARQSHIASNYEHAEKYDESKEGLVQDAILDREVKIYNDTHTPKRTTTKESS